MISSPWLHQARMYVLQIKLNIKSMRMEVLTKLASSLSIQIADPDSHNVPSYSVDKRSGWTMVLWQITYHKSMHFFKKKITNKAASWKNTEFVLELERSNC